MIVGIGAVAAYRTFWLKAAVSIERRTSPGSPDHP
jgi:hypothetical protein